MEGIIPMMGGFRGFMILPSGQGEAPFPCSRLSTGSDGSVKLYALPSGGRMDLPWNQSG